MSTYTREQVEDLLAYMFNGGHWGRTDAPDDDMPKAKANPSHLGGNMAEMIDIKRAWDECYVFLYSPEALYFRYGQDKRIREIASDLTTPVMTIQDHLVADVGVLVEEINTGNHRRARRAMNVALGGMGIFREDVAA